MNTNRILAAFLTASSLAVPPSFAQTLFEEQSKETIKVTRGKDGQVVTEQQRVIYTPQMVYLEKQPILQILRETYRTSQQSNLEGVRSDVRVDLFRPGKDGRYPPAPSHSIGIPNVHEVKFLDDHWKAMTFGCCDAEPYGRLYTYGGDKPFLRYNEEYWRMEVPNSPIARYAGFVLRDHVPGDAAEAAVFGEHPDAVACLAYAAPGKPLDSVYLEPRRGAEKKPGLHSANFDVRSAYPRDEVRADQHTVQLWSLDGAVDANKNKTAVSGVTITAGVFVDDGSTETLTVRVENDRFTDIRVEGKTLGAIRAGAK